MVSAVGVDGCKRGWVAAWRGGCAVWPRLAGLLRELQPEVLGLDMPIGLTDDGPRACDRLARQRLGRPRASSVFAPPVRAALGAADYPEASARNVAACGKRISIQSWHLFDKLHEVDVLLRGDARARARVVEVHPEVSFAAWAGAPMSHNKKRRAGRAERQALIAADFGADAWPAARANVARRDAAHDDIADAFAALWSAERIGRGDHGSLPDPAPTDAAGLPMRICF